MQRLLAVLCAFMVLPMTAAAQYPMSKSPWQTTVTINERWGPTTYQIWLDEYFEDTENPNRPAKWPVFQDYCRYVGMRYFPHAWGESEYNRGLNARQAMDITYQPLRQSTFVALNISVIGDLPAAGGPSFLGPADSLVLTLRDGRQIANFPSPKLPYGEATLTRRGTMVVNAANQLARCMNSQPLFTELQLSELPKHQPSVYGDRPKANIFVLRFDNGGKDFNLRDLTSVCLVFRRQRVIFQPDSAVLTSRY